MEEDVDLVLVISTSLYAWWLSNHRRQEPDWTWLEVVAGTSICLLAAALRYRLSGRRDWQSYEHYIWRAFALGGAPIIAGEVSQALRDWQARDSYQPPWRR